MPLGEWLKKSVNCVKSVPNFCHQRANASFGQPFFSLVLGHAVLGDVVGPLPKSKGRFLYIHCPIDSATRLGDAIKMRDTSATSILRVLQ